MPISTLSLIIISSFGFIISGFFSAYLLSSKKSKNGLHLLLGALLLMLTIRIGKSVFYNFTILPLTIKNIGLAANLAIGPLLFLYGKVLLYRDRVLKWHIWHFFPTILYLIGSPIFPNQLGSHLWYISYSFVILQQLVYLILCSRLIVNWHLPKQRHFLILLLGISFIWLVYLFIFLGFLPVYIFGAVAYSVLVILLVFLISQEKFSFFYKEKYSQSRLSKKQAERNLQLIRQQIERNKLFLNPSLSIQDIVQKTNLSTKVVSQVINEQTGLNFSAFINTYRIKESKQRLLNPHFQNLTIASIAYDCGFNSISSFNTTFKAMTKQTPSQFRRAALPNLGER